MKTQELSHELERSAPPALDPAFRRRVRDAVLNAAAHPSPSPAPRIGRFPIPSPHPTFALTAAFLLIGLLVFGLGTTVVADAAKPGDLLYPWDRGVEVVRRSFTIGSESRAAYDAAVAEERFTELVELASHRPAEVPEARSETSRALRQAIQTVTEVQDEQAERGNDRATERLQSINERLRGLQQRHLESSQADDLKPQGLTEAEARVGSNQTIVSLTFNGSEQTFTVLSTQTSEIIQAIVDRTGFDAGTVSAVLRIEVEEPETEHVQVITPGEANDNLNADRRSDEPDHPTEPNDVTPSPDD